MDINANLAEQRRIIEACTDGRDWDAERLVDLVEAMHEWLDKGGALPAIWEANRPKGEPELQEPERDTSMDCAYCGLLGGH